MTRKIILIFILFFGVVNAENTITVSKAVKMAIKNNHKLNENRQKVKEAYWSRWEARSNHIPTVKLGYTKLRNDEETVIPAGMFGPQPVVIQPLETGSQSVDVTVPLFTGGAIFSGSKIAGTSYKMQKLSYQENEEMTKASTIEAYYNVVRIKGIVDITEDTKKLIDENIRMTKKMYNIGMVEKKDLLKAEVSSIEIDQQLLSAKQGLEIAKSSLNILIGKPINNSFEFDENIPDVKFDKAEKEIIKHAKENRANYQSLLMTEKIAKWGVRASRGEYFPSVAGVWHWEKSDAESMFSRSESWRVMLNVSYEIPLGLGNIARVQKAKAKLRQSEEVIGQVETGLEMELKSNLLNYNLSEEKLTLSSKQVKASKENYEAVEANYKSGNSNQIELTDARNSYSNSQIKLIATKIDCYISYIKLLQSCGYEINI
ncbi:MAG: TolC family protein [Candidatus Marinimicrobia bacterium]|nr:TolC family protein [Candidatus Neomarinimicrobiota bacterium]